MNGWISSGYLSYLESVEQLENGIPRVSTTVNPEADERHGGIGIGSEKATNGQARVDISVFEDRVKERR